VGTTRASAAGSAPAASATPDTVVADRSVAETTTEAVDAALADADRAIRTAATTPPLLTDTAAGPARPAVSRPDSAGITRETTLDEAALRLANDLRAVPGIERFAGTRLADLESAGPRPLRTMWRISREHLDQRYGQLTIGELIERYGRGQSPPA
jgi:hypothetical protein